MLKNEGSSRDACGMKVARGLEGCSQLNSEDVLERLRCLERSPEQTLADAKSGSFSEWLQGCMER